MPKYVEIQPAPRIIEAMIITKGNEQEIEEFCPDIGVSIDFHKEPIMQISVKDNKGYVRIANPGDWLVKDANGHYTVETFLEFAAMYRVIEEE